MKIQMLKKPALGYSGQVSKLVVAYVEEMSKIEEYIIDGIDYVSDVANDLYNNAKFCAEAYVYVATGQAGRDAVDWLLEDVSVSVNQTPQGGVELRVDTPAGHTELYANPPVTVQDDSIRANVSTNVGGVQIGTSTTVKNPGG